MKLAILSSCHECLLPAPWKWHVCPIYDCSGQGSRVFSWVTSPRRDSERCVTALWFCALPSESVSAHSMEPENRHSSESGCFTKCSLSVHRSWSTLELTRTGVGPQICSCFSRAVAPALGLLPSISNVGFQVNMLWVCFTPNFHSSPFFFLMTLCYVRRFLVL